MAEPPGEVDKANQTTPVDNTSVNSAPDETANNSLTTDGGDQSTEEQITLLLIDNASNPENQLNKRSIVVPTEHCQTARWPGNIVLLRDTFTSSPQVSHRLYSWYRLCSNWNVWASHSPSNSDMPAVGHQTCSWVGNFK